MDKENLGQIIAIGGGGFGRNPYKRKIEKYIIDQCDKQKPNICFIPTASAEDKAYTVKLNALLTGLFTHASNLKKSNHGQLYLIPLL